MSGICSEGIGEQNTLYSPPDKTKSFTKVYLFLQSTQLIGTEVFMTLSIEHIILVVRIAAIKWP